MNCSDYVAVVRGSSNRGVTRQANGQRLETGIVMSVFFDEQTKSLKLKESWLTQVRHGWAQWKTDGAAI